MFLFFSLWCSRFGGGGGGVGIKKLQPTICILLLTILVLTIDLLLIATYKMLLKQKGFNALSSKTNEPPSPCSILDFKK
jgi:hypothetical protein